MKLWSIFREALTVTLSAGAGATPSSDFSERRGAALLRDEG